MSWFEKIMPSRIKTEREGRTRSVPEGLWIKCEACDAVLYRPELERNLSEVVGPVPRLRHIAELGAGYGPAVGDWRLWLELWVRAIRDDDARAARESLDTRWRGALRQVVDEGLASGVFAASDPKASVLRLAALMDGLAIQLALADPGMTTGKFTELWWQSAVLELGISSVNTAKGPQGGQKKR